MPTVPDIHRRGTRAAQPAATAVTVGTLYFVTDEDVTERSNGTTWETYSGSGTGTVLTKLVGIVIDGGGSAITTGIKGFVRVNYAGTITKWTLLSIDAAATAGSLVVDVWKDTYTNYPPTIADTITAAAPPTLSSAAKNESTTLTGWTTAVAVGDVFGFNVASVTGVTKAILELEVTL